jgi:hypothetical protein
MIPEVDNTSTALRAIALCLATSLSLSFLPKSRLESPFLFFIFYFISSFYIMTVKNTCTTHYNSNYGGGGRGGQETKP